VWTNPIIFYRVKRENAQYALAYFRLLGSASLKGPAYSVEHRLTRVILFKKLALEVGFEREREEWQDRDKRLKLFYSPL
jgi:hypothetical protein